MSRFIPKKNLPGLIEPYGADQVEGGRLGLRILGGGDLEPELRRGVASLPQPERVQLAGFEQLEDVVLSYGRASALVLASSSDQWRLLVSEVMATARKRLASFSPAAFASGLLQAVTWALTHQRQFYRGHLMAQLLSGESPWNIHLS